MIRVLSTPIPGTWEKHESGIRRVVDAYAKYLPDYGVELVGPNDEADLFAVHAGTSLKADVAHCHGLYWTADYRSPSWEWRGNEHVINSVRHAKVVTVPSRWVAESFERDMRFSPIVIGHGVDWDDWQHSRRDLGYILWNKNRGEDVCDPYPVTRLARTYKNQKFMTTFSRGKITSNVKVTGLLPHDQMRVAIQECSVYLATTKETFGIGTLEAMASGKPVLGFSHGGILEMVEHGVNGYLAAPGDYEDLENGLDYCLKYKKILGENGREMAKGFSWEGQVEKVADAYRLALDIASEEPIVDVIIPVYNKNPEQLDRAIKSASTQEEYLGKIIVVDDGSTIDDAEELYKSVVDNYDNAIYFRKANGGVASARNFGISQGKSKYILCLDSDDAIKPKFLSACVPPLQDDESLGVTFTGLTYIKPDGETGLSPWPDGYEYDKFFRRQNQVPTAAVFRRKMWERLGGYKSRYCPDGAGSEDAEFWFRAGAYGWGGKKVTDAGLFVYSWLSGQVSGNSDYKEIDWLAWHPWAKDDLHPFASVSKPSRNSHPVRQYDEPTISVIIPVGPGHERDLENALDSLEAQHLRRWEAVVVDDTDGDVSDIYKTAYPYVKWHKTPKPMSGSGVARNIGVDNSRASLIIFLDADDFLFPDSLKDMFNEWERTGGAIYSGYYGRAIIDDKTKLSRKVRSNIVREEDDNEKVIKYSSADFDCNRALRQPENPPYVWNTVSTLFPKAWHYEVGGFDESMPSWEDVLYWYKMAWNAKCFYRIDKPLMMYKFYSGSRREIGIELGTKLIDYIEAEKSKTNLSKARMMGCNCKQKQPMQPPSQSESIALEGEQLMENDNDYVLVQYNSPNKGQHSVIGFNTKTHYGYRRGGDTFLIKHDDYLAQKHMFTIVDKMSQSKRFIESGKTKPPDAPELIVEHDDVTEDDENFDLQILPGITPVIADRMRNTGLATPDLILQHGEDSLVAIKGLGKIKAKMVYEYVEENYGNS